MVRVKEFSFFLSLVAGEGGEGGAWGLRLKGLDTLGPGDSRA